MSKNFIPMKKRILLFLSFLPGLMACGDVFNQVKTVDIDEGPRRLVLLSNFENIYSPKVQLTLSGLRPYYYHWGSAIPIPVNPYPKAPPATVEVFEDGKSLGFLVSDTASVYSFPSPYIPLPGKTYRLEVKAEGYGTVQAQGRIPAPAPIEAVLTGNYKQLKRWNGTREVAEIKLTLQDIPGERNFYGLIIQSHREDITGESSGGRGHYIYTSDILFEDEASFSLGSDFNGYREIGYGKNLFNDLTFEGKKKEILVYLDVENAEMAGLSSIYFKLQNMSEDSYKYHLTREKSRNDSENPFVQPTLIHSNIDGGGLGIFGTFSVTYDSLKVVTADTSLQSRGL